MPSVVCVCSQGVFARVVDKDSSWSDAIAVDTPGSISIVGINGDNSKQYQFFASVAVAPSPYIRTRIVTFAPRYCRSGLRILSLPLHSHLVVSLLIRFALVNKLGVPIEIRQIAEVAAPELHYLEPGQRLLLLSWPKDGKYYGIGLAPI